MVDEVQEHSAVDRLLASMGRWGASDVFVSVGKAPAARVNGDVTPVDLPPTTAEEMEAYHRSKHRSDDPMANMAEAATDDEAD